MISAAPAKRRCRIFLQTNSRRHHLISHSNWSVAKQNEMPSKWMPFWIFKIFSQNTILVGTDIDLTKDVCPGASVGPLITLKLLLLAVAHDKKEN